MTLNIVEMIVENPKLVELNALPKRATDGSAGYDISSCEENAITLYPGQSYTFNLGFKLWIKDPMWAGIIVPRSGLGMRHGVGLRNTIGLMDSDYQGVWMLGLEKSNSPGVEPLTLHPGDRLAQIVFLPVGLPDINLVESFNEETARGQGGFGSTGLTAVA